MFLPVVAVRRAAGRWRIWARCLFLYSFLSTACLSERLHNSIQFA